MEATELSPIVAIKQKELELADRLMAAKQKAERAILAAQQWAAARRDQAESEGQAEAAAFYRAELDATEAEAERIRTEGGRAAVRIAEGGRPALDQAVPRILEIALPPLSGESG